MKLNQTLAALQKIASASTALSLAVKEEIASAQSQKVAAEARAILAESALQKSASAVADIVEEAGILRGDKAQFIAGLVRDPAEIGKVVRKYASLSSPREPGQAIEEPSDSGYPDGMGEKSKAFFGS